MAPFASERGLRTIDDRVPVQSPTLERRADFLRALRIPGALAIIVLIALFLRFHGQNWDAGLDLNPDEHTITALAPKIHWPSSIAGYFDTATSPLNPLNAVPSFVYGTFPLFLGKALEQLTGNRGATTWPTAFRSLSALFDLLTVVMLFAIGRRLFGQSAGLLAALLYALCVLPIQYAHFGTFDLAGPSLELLTFLFCLRAIEHGRWRDFLALGVFAGLAVASQLSLLPVLAMALFPAIEAARIAPPATTWRARLDPLGPVVLRTEVALLAAVLAIRLALPYAFAGPGFFGIRIDPRWQQDIAHWRAVQSGAVDTFSSIQWSHRRPVLFALENLVLWGMGPALGIAALAALGFALARFLTVRKLPPAWMLLLVGWPLFYLLHVGTSFDQSMRKLLPAYPFLVLIAAAGLVEFGRWLQRRTRRVWLALVPAALVVGFTALWAFAFLSVYTHPTTRSTASEWVYRNVPHGDTILIEQGDAQFPLGGISGGSPADFEIVTLPMFDPDTQAKADNLVAQLANADYIVLTSNRIPEAVARIPERFPMTIAYYAALFDGRLGFAKAATITSYPELAGIRIDDSSAEEAFTAVDHPNITIFRKADSFDAANARTILDSALNTEIFDISSLNGGHNAAKMTDQEWNAQIAGGTWADAWHAGDFANRHPAIVWYLAIQLFALLAIPLSWRALPGLPDRGYAASKSIGFLIVSVVSWLLPSYRLMPFGRGAALAGMVVLGCLSVAAVWPARRTLMSDLRARWYWIVSAEIIFATAYLLLVDLRSRNPDIWHPEFSGEKPFELAFFTAIAKSTWFPPYDPWYAGGVINYYYFGWVMHAMVSRLTGIVPAVAFNLSVVTIGALIVLEAWSFTASALALLAPLVRFRSRWTPIAGGLVGTLFFAVLGNLDFARRIGTRQWGNLDQFDHSASMRYLGTVGDIVRGIWRALTGNADVPAAGFYRASRVIPHTINEFPFFSILYADLHPHLMAMPITLLALILALGFVAGPSWPEATSSDSPENQRLFGIARGWRAWFGGLRQRPLAQRFWLAFIAAVVTGVLFPLNTWDYPTYLLVTAAAVFIVDCLGSASESERTRSTGWRFWYTQVRRAALTAVGILITGRLIFLPYYRGYLEHSTGTVRVPETSPTGDFLLVFGFFIFLLVSFLLVDLAHSTGDIVVTRVRVAGRPFRLPAVFVLAVLPAALLFYAIGSSLVIFGLVGILLLLAPAVSIHRREPIFLALLLMATLAIALALFVERFALHGDNGRMNTVFKIHLEVWMLLSLTTAIFAILLLLAPRYSMPAGITSPWFGIAVVLFAGVLLYPILAPAGRNTQRVGADDITLDGMAFMQGSQTDQVDRSADDTAIRWIQENIPGSPVMIGSHARSFGWGLQTSIFAGLPTIIGWDDGPHEPQERPFAPASIAQRANDLQTIMGQPGSFESIQPLLDKYRVEYIYVGPFETSMYGAEALQKFQIAAQNGLLDVIYENAGVVIYRYRPAGMGTTG